MSMDRRMWLKSVALAAGAVGAGTAAAEAPSAKVRVEAKGASRADFGPVLERLARYADLQLQTFGLPGMTISVADRDGFRAVITTGWADVDRREAVGPNHLFQIGSISKSFAALSILKLSDAGKLSLNTPVADLLPEAPLPKSPRFQVRHLLDHSSGLPDDAPLFPRGIDGLWCGFEPGSRMSYSNIGYDLLGLMLERVDGRPLTEIHKANVLDPLGMGATQPAIRDADRALYATGYAPFYRDRAFLRRDRLSESPWTPSVRAAGSIASTPSDMARYIAFLIEAGQGRGAPILSDSTAKRFVSPTIDAPVFGPDARYACGLAVVPVNKRRCLHHTGGMIAFSSSIHVDPDAGVGAFASVNARGGPSWRPREVTAYGVALLAAARAGQPLPASPAIPAAAAADDNDAAAAPLVSAAGETLEIANASGALAVRWNGKPVELERAGDLVFLRHPRFAAFPLKLNRRDGRIVSAWWGPTLFAASAAERNPAPAPDYLRALAGRYDNDDPWSEGPVHVVARADGLWLDGVTPLQALPDGSYRIGPETWSPERVRFDSILNGRAQRVNISGVDLRRTGDVLEA